MDTQILYILNQASQYFIDHHQQAYLVGGSLRNLLLNEPCTDLDIVTPGPGDPHKLARSLADKLGGHYIHMHEKASRIVVKQGNQEITIDISPLSGNTIEDDLRKRDFTINAMAATLSDIVHYFESDNAVQSHTGLPPQPPPPPGRSQGSPLPYTKLPNRNMVGAILAIALRAGGSRLIDPLHGLADLQERTLKAAGDDVFRNDPLRMLRAVRLMTRYHLSIDPRTADLLKRDASLLAQVAPERIHDELYAILEPDGATDRLRFLDEHGLFTILFPEFIPARGMRQPRPHYWDVFEHSVETVGAVEYLARILQNGDVEANRGDFEGGGFGKSSSQPDRVPPARATQASSPLIPATPAPTGGVGSSFVGSGDLSEIRTLLLEAEQQNIFSFAALTSPRMKLAALLHDIGKTVTYSTDEEGNIHFYNHPQAGVPLVQQILKRLCAGTQDRRLAQLVAAHHMRPGQLAQVDPVTPRAIRRYFVDLGATGSYVALISLADHLATLGPQAPGDSWTRHLALVRLLLTRYIRERDSILPPRLIGPEELMRRLRLEAGPQVGQLLELIAEAQAEGRIHSKEEALWLAEEKLHQQHS